jgi:hypothetical protein
VSLCAPIHAPLLPPAPSRMPPERGGGGGASGSRGGGGGGSNGGNDAPFFTTVNGYEVPARTLPASSSSSFAIDDEGNQSRSKQRRILVQREPAEHACRHLAIQRALDEDEDEGGDAADDAAMRTAAHQDVDDADGAVAVQRFRQRFGARLGPAPARSAADVAPVVRSWCNSRVSLDWLLCGPTGCHHSCGMCVLK